MAQETLSSTRTALAVAVAACSLTLTVGITTAALLGYLGSGSPSAATGTVPAATSTADQPAPDGAPAVVLVPVRPAIEEPAVRGPGGDPRGLRYASAREDDRDDRRWDDEERRHEREDED